MAHSSWAWANENYQGPKKSMKKTHEHHNNDGNDRTLQKVELSGMGFSLYLLSSGNPYKNGFLYTFTYEPSSSQCLQKTSPFHSTLFCSLHQLSLSLSLSLSPILFHSLLWWTFWDIVIFLVCVAAEVLGFVWFQFLCVIPNLGISGNCKLWET